jgi:hypothetical protein
MKEVKVYVLIHGQYVSFNEIGFRVVYDITNNKQLDDYTLDDLEDWEYEEGEDIKIVDAIKIDEKYYIDLIL